jgi:excisionase family DNA binding protein
MDSIKGGKPVQAVPDALTTKQVAERLRVKPDTVRQWIADGKLPAFRVGSRLRVLGEDVGRMVVEAGKETAA